MPNLPGLQIYSGMLVYHYNEKKPKENFLNFVFVFPVTNIVRKEAVVL